MWSIPPRYSLRWLRVLLGYFLLTYAFVSLPQLVYGSVVALRPLLSLALLSLGAALMPCVAGCMGGGAFFGAYTACAYLGAVNMLNFAMLTGSYGWGDLRVYEIFLAFVALGMGAGLLAQAAASIVSLIRRFVRARS